MNVLERIFLKFTDGKTEFFVRCRRTYIVDKYIILFKLSKKEQGTLCIFPSVFKEYIISISSTKKGMMCYVDILDQVQLTVKGSSNRTIPRVEEP